MDRRLWPARAAFLLAKPKRDSQMLERIDRGVGEGRETLSNTRTRVKNNTYVQEG